MSADALHSGENAAAESVGLHMIGRTLAHYEILDRLGKGGMGEVYLALDRKLDRKVALKVLPPELASDPELVERFEREAKTVAALNHPNIVTLHSVEEAGGVRFLTMERVEGEGLDRKIPRGGLPLERFFELAVPLVAAVATAHESGVTPRDLKPANLMVTHDGRLKVLDFGLAKLRERPASPAMEAPTEALTREGLVVGTVPYMSPEQLQGGTIDSRSDIFSLGIILYEMLTGRRPFAGKSSAEVISALLRDTPTPVEELRPRAPRQLARLVRRCLEKDAAQRLQSARDLLIELEEVRRESERDATAAGGTETRAAPRRKALGIAAAILAVLGATALAILWRQSPAEEAEPLAPLHLTKLTGAPGLEDEPAWSPDGKFLAYTTDQRGNLDILVQPIGGGQVIRAFESDADEAQPAFSPDGSQIAFVSARDRDGDLRPGIGWGPLTPLLIGGGGDLFVGPAFGGPALKLAEDAYSPAWSPDGRKIAFSSPGDGTSTISTVSASGGQLERLTTDDLAFQPAWSPDGSRIAYGAIETDSGEFDLRVIPAAGGPPKKIFGFPAGAQVLEPAWSADGAFLYFTSNLGGRYNIWRVRAPIDPDAEAGEPEQVTFGGGADVSVSVEPTSGRLAFSTVDVDVSLWQLDLGTGATRQITFETGHEGNAQASPDGRTLLVATDRRGEWEIWVYDLAGEALSAVGPSFSLDFPGLWSPDGKLVAYTRPGAARLPTVVYKELGSMSETVLLENGFGGEWSPDGAELLAMQFRPDGSGYTDIVAVSPEGKRVRRLTAGDAVSNFPTWSPDGREVMYNSTAGGIRKLWRLPAAGGDPEQVTFGPDEDSHPRWSRTDPNSVLFLRNHATLCLLDLSTGEVRELEPDLSSHFGLDYPSWSADGTHIYFSVAAKTGDVYVTEE